MASKWEIKFDQAKLREAKEVFRKIAASIDPAESISLNSLWSVAQKEVQNGFRAAAIVVRDKARSYAASAQVPKRLYTGARPAIFAFSDFDAARDDKRKRSALVGVRTGLSHRAPDPTLYVRWGSGHKRRKGGSVASGGLSMSLAAIFERGTANRRIKATRYFRSAVFSTRSAIANMLTQAYYRAAAHINRNK